MSSICPINGWGVCSRVPLYSAYSCVRKVPPGRSKATATWVGASCSISDRNMEVKPCTALVAWPVEVVKESTGRAKKARKAIECPSMSSSRPLVAGAWSVPGWSGVVEVVLTVPAYGYEPDRVCTPARLDPAGLAQP